MHKKKKPQNLAELAGRSGLFSAVPHVSVPGNAALQVQPQTLFYHNGKSVTVSPRAVLASWGLIADAVYRNVRRKGLFTCLLLSLLAAQFPVSLSYCSESLCCFDQKWIVRKRHSNMREAISVWVRNRITVIPKSSGQCKVKSEGQSLQLWNSGFMLSQE